MGNYITLKEKFLVIIMLIPEIGIALIKFIKIPQLIIYAAGEDGTIKLFDTPNDIVIISIPTAHYDFIKCIAEYEEQQLSSSYDKTIKIFESKLILPNNFILSLHKINLPLSEILEKKIVFKNQIQTSSLLLLCPQFNVIIQLDKLQVLKYIRPDILTVTHQLRWKTPVMALDASQDGFNIAIGGSEGQLQINQLKQSKSDQDIEEYNIPEYLKSNLLLQRRINKYKFYNKGIYFKLTDYYFKTPLMQNQKFSSYDKLLVTFMQKETFLKQLKKRNFISGVEEFQERGVLEELQMILHFILQKMPNPKYSHSMLHVLDKLIDLHNIGDIYEQAILKGTIVMRINITNFIQQQ